MGDEIESDEDKPNEKKSSRPSRRSSAVSLDPPMTVVRTSSRKHRSSGILPTLDTDDFRRVEEEELVAVLALVEVDVGPVA